MSFLVLLAFFSNAQKVRIYMPAARHNVLKVPSFNVRSYDRFTKNYMGKQATHKLSTGNSDTKWQPLRGQILVALDGLDPLVALSAHSICAAALVGSFARRSGSDSTLRFRPASLSSSPDDDSLCLVDRGP